MAKKNRLMPSANSGPAVETEPAEQKVNQPRTAARSSVNSLSSQTTLARRRAQVEAAGSSDREPGTVRRTAGRQVFKVTEGGQKARKKKPAGKAQDDGARRLRTKAKGGLAPAIVTDDITEEQARRLRKAEERERRRRRAAIRSNHIGTRIAMAIAAYVILTGGVFAALFLYFIPKNDTGQTNNFTYQFGPDVGYTERRTVAWYVARDDGRLYVDMTGIAGFCDLAVTGDGKNIRFIVKSSGQYLEFTPGTSDVTANGSKLKMGGVCRSSDGRIYIPYDFADRLISGITLSYNERRHRITTERTEAPVSFPFSVISETGAISFDSLDPDLQKEINERQIIAAENQEVYDYGE